MPQASELQLQMQQLTANLLVACVLTRKRAGSNERGENTPGWLYLWMRAKEEPPQMATPCLCRVARKEPWGDHCTKDSVQNVLEYTYRAWTASSGQPQNGYSEA